MQQFIFQNYSIATVSSLLTVLLFLLLRPLAFKISLVDTPNHRKKHDFTTPLIGGLCIFLASTLSLFSFSEFLSADFIALIIGSGLMLALGVIDDQFDLSANIKLFAQIAIVTIFILSSERTVSNLGAPFGFSTLLELGILSIPFTLLAIIGFTNAINMIDGCDGLAGSLIIISLLALLIFGYTHLDHLKIVFLLILLSSLLVFLFFNFTTNKNLKTFLGDGGSLFLGFIVAVSLIEFAEVNTSYDPSIVLWFAAVPIFDFSAVVLKRVLLKKRITSADRSHIHHYILSMGFSHIQTTMLISASAVALLFIGLFMTLNYPDLSFLSFFMLFILYLSFRVFADRAK